MFTSPEHRRRGLAGRLCRHLLDSWDRAHPKDSLVLLGTGAPPEHPPVSSIPSPGSPHAAKMYSREGFHHLLGGLEGGSKGYNKEDLGEWLMVRWKAQTGEITSLPGDFYGHDPRPADFRIEELQRRHLAGLVLLLAAQEGDSKLSSCDIHTGLEAEEGLLKLLASTTASGLVAVHVGSGRIHGICVKKEGREEKYVVSRGAGQALTSHNISVSMM